MRADESTRTRQPSASFFQLQGSEIESLNRDRGGLHVYLWRSIGKIFVHKYVETLFSLFKCSTR